MTILEISNLSIKHQEDYITKDVNISVQAGEWRALVGESGSGKSVTASAIGGLLHQSLTLEKGKIQLQGKDLVPLKEKEKQQVRGKEISYIFQDYQGAFTPFIKIGKQFDEMLKSHVDLSKGDRKALSLQALKEVKLPEGKVYNSYPFQLSGGQLQRAAIAMAMMLKPKLLIADEPTTALDSITSMKVLELIAQLKEQTNCGVLFITHDLRHVRKYADTVSIMFKGDIVESESKEIIFQYPKHEYTRKLFAAIPPLREDPKRLLSIN